MNNLEAALAYIARGWAVIPVWNMDEGGDCSCGGSPSCKPGKHPIWKLVPHGVKDASLDEGTVRDWWGQYPDANVAIATGQASGGLVVIDIDPRNGGSFSVLRDALGDSGTEVEMSVMATTGGGGWHIYTEADQEVAGKGNIVCGIDIKGEGGYIIAPPSNHESGGVYAFSRPTGGLESISTANLCKTPAQRLDELTGHPGAKQDHVGLSARDAVELPRSFDPHTASPDAARVRGLMEDNPRARKAFNRELTDIDDRSGSGQDMALANIAAKAGWEALEIAALIASARRRAGDRPNGRGYYASTVGAALVAQEKEAGIEPVEHELPEIVIEDMYEVAELEIPERELLIAPWMKQRDLGLVFAKRGVGKTYFVLSLACAVATGTDLFGWEVPTARKTLYIDGEMDLADLRMRIAGILAGRNAAIGRGMLQILSRDRMMMLGKRLAYLTESDTRRALMDAIDDDVELVVLDNLSCLVGGEENDSQAWDSLQSLILELRFRGIAVIMIHHAGKGGQQRGTSRREDVLDFSINLQQIGDDDDPESGRFKVTWSKRRGFSGEDASPFEARMDVEEDGTVTWTTAAPDATTVDRLVDGYWELFNDNDKAPSIRELAEYMEMSKSAVHRMVRKAKEEGRI